MRRAGTEDASFSFAVLKRTDIGYYVIVFYSLPFYCLPYCDDHWNSLYWKF